MTMQQIILDQMAPSFFPVVEKTVMVGDTLSSGHKGIVRVDTGEILAIHGEGYNLSSNEQIMTQFVEALVNSGLNLDGARVTNELSHGGARMFSKITLPSHRLVIRTGDEVDLQISVVNSYDGWSALRSIFGGFRLLCSNGMVVGTKMWEGYGRHTTNLDISAAANRLHNVASSYSEVGKVWTQWSASRILEGQFETIAEAVTPVEKSRETLVEQFRAESVDLGPTVWAAYNALTNWSTHTSSTRKGAEQTQAAGRFQREEQVRKVMPMLYAIAG